MSRVSSILAIVLALLSLPTALHAQAAQDSSAAVPRLINIAGAFRPADGQPPGPTATVTLAIYADAEGGAPVWQETQTVALDDKGRYSLLLGASSPDGIPASVFGSGAPQWLGTRFERPGEVEGPRVRLTSVPYSLRAADADTLGGRPASEYLLAPGAGGTTDAHAATAETGGASNDVVLAGTPNFLAKYVNGADVGSSGVFEAADGSIGLGTTTPFDRLHVRYDNNTGDFTGLAVQNTNGGALAYSGMLFFDHTNALTQFQGYNNATHEYRINNIARVSPGGAFNGSINFMLGGTSKFLVAPNGNIGIGTTTPAANLEVSNASGATPFTNVFATTYANSGAGAAFFGRKARGTPAAPSAVLSGDNLALFFGRGFGTTAFGPGGGSIFIRAAQNWTDTAQGTAIHFATTPVGTTTQVQSMTLDPFGNLGLGTSGPLAALDMVKETPGPLEINLTRYAGTSSSGEPNIVLRTARGTRAAPSAVQAGDELGGFAATGYGATGFVGDGGAGFGAFAAENWTDTAQGSALGLFATPIGLAEGQVNMLIMPGGNIGIGVFNDFPTISDKLQVFGDIRVGTTGTNGCIRNFAGTGIAGTCSSDRRFKKDVTPFRPVLNQLTALQPVHYFWRAADFPQQHFGDSRAYGLIAQDVEEVLPELVVTGEDGFKAVDYSKLPLLTIQAVKELKGENDALKQRVAELERLVTELLASVPRR